MLKQCITLLTHAMMLKQCLTLLKHSKTVVNTLSLERAVSCEQEVKSLVSWSLSRTRSELWARGQEPCELISLSRTRCELWARVQEPCELISLSLERVLSCEQEPFEPSLSLACELWAERLVHKILAWLTPTVQRCNTFCYSVSYGNSLHYMVLY